MTNLFKIMASNLFASNSFNSVLGFFAYPIIKVHSNKKQNQKSNKTVSLTIDCESGYLKNNNGRVWMFKDPFAFQGYYQGMKNLLSILEKNKIKATFFISTQCFYAEGEERSKIIDILNKIYKKKHEIALHLHPKEDFELQRKLGKKLNFSGARFYSPEEIDSMIKKSLELIEENLGKDIADSIKSFRFGNFAADIRTFEVLEKNGFVVDSSACPGCSGHKGDDREYAWNFLEEDMGRTHLTEIPITTFWFFGWRRADPSIGSLTNMAFKKYPQSAFPFVVITHSSECTHENGVPTYVANNLNNFILAAKKENAKFVTLSRTKEALK